MFLKFFEFLLLLLFFFGIAPLRPNVSLWHIYLTFRLDHLDESSVRIKIKLDFSKAELIIGRTTTKFKMSMIIPRDTDPFWHIFGCVKGEQHIILIDDVVLKKTFPSFVRIKDKDDLFGRTLVDFSYLKELNYGNM